MPDYLVQPPILQYSDFLLSPATVLQTLNTKEGALLLLDKPYGFTSFSMVHRLRMILTRASHDKWVKVGHGGTLDPLATGLLVLASRRSTHFLTHLLSLEKTYWCELRLGVATPSFDLETPIMVVSDLKDIKAEKIIPVVKSFVGEQFQRPPIYSAVKLKGKPMYKHARKGRDIEMAEKSIIIHSIENIEIEMPFVRFRANCSKGTYIRSLVADIGAKLGTGAVLINLKREKIGQWRVDDAIDAKMLECLGKISSESL